MEKNATVIPGDRGRNNNFGLLRLFFALLVIVSHSPELVDGNRSRELLSRLCGTLSFGEVAVDGFFLISGFLIVKSFAETRSLSSYSLKRVFRIVPGYLVCYWACVLLLAPQVGAHYIDIAKSLPELTAKSALLLQPYVPGAFHGLHLELLNGSVWTIAYEFRCYVAAALLGLVGFYNPRVRSLLAILALSLLVLNASHYLGDTRMPGDSFLGTVDKNVRFLSVFLVGALYFVFRDKIAFTNAGAVAAALLLIPLFYFNVTAEAAFAVFGGYLIFWFAFKVPVMHVKLVGQNRDISYGVYLYAWPVQNSLIWLNPTINPWVLCGITIICAAFLGFISWTIIEKPAMGILHARVVSFTEQRISQRAA